MVHNSLGEWFSRAQDITSDMLGVVLIYSMIVGKETVIWERCWIPARQRSHITLDIYVDERNQTCQDTPFFGEFHFSVLWENGLQ